jgi:hypothetical protein
MFTFDKKDLLPSPTIEDIEKYCDSYDLFRHYIGEFTIGKPILSPLREETKPSFAIFTANGKVLFNDFLLGGGDIVKFVMLRFTLSFRQALNKVAHDAGLQDKFNTEHDYVPTKLIRYEKKISDDVVKLDVKSRKFNASDEKFWKSFGIDMKTLLKYRVSPISHIFYNTKIAAIGSFAYVFKEFKDSMTSLTIYQPYSKLNKWKKSHDSSVFYGWSQLPASGDTLVITKSMKDVMTIDSITGIPAVALQNEKIKPKKHIIEQLKKRFKNIYLLYDNDYNNEVAGKLNYGRVFGRSIAEEFDLIQIEIPDHIAIEHTAKDLSDLAKNAGEKYVKEILDEQIKAKINRND